MKWIQNVFARVEQSQMLPIWVACGKHVMNCTQTAAWLDLLLLVFLFRVTFYMGFSSSSYYYYYNYY